MLHRARSPLAAAMVVVASLLFSLHVAAAPPSSSSSPPSASEALAETLRETAPDSPRAAVEAFLDLCRDERFEEASKYLELSAAQRPRAAELAERFKRVLDRHAWIDLSSVSGAPEGASNDGMAPNVDELATVPAGAGRTDPVRLVRVAQGAGGENGVRWMFSRGTVNRIDAWYERLDHRWIFENLPPILLKSGPFELMVWQWLALPAVFFLAWLVGWMLARLSRGVLIRLARRTRVQWDDAMIAQMNGPLVLAWSLVAARLALPWLGLYAPAEAWIHRGIRAGLFLAFFWALMRGLSVVASLLGSSTWSNLNPASRSLIPLGTRVGKVLLVAVALVAMLAELGYPVASLIAGLGIGGLAVALAAQKTVENLFGAFSLGVDQPFREGDFVKIEDFVGTVEAIGLRSTRVRTLDRTVISIPNGKLAEMRLETFAARDRIRLYCKLGLVYSTPPERMRAILAGLERVLRDHPKIWPDSVTVRFEAFGASSLDIEIMAWFLTQDFDEFKEIRQNLFLDFMDVVEKNGSSFAFPTRTIQLIDERHVQEPERRSRP